MSFDFTSLMEQLRQCNKTMHTDLSTLASPLEPAP
jgi:hypothetical protein